MMDGDVANSCADTCCGSDPSAPLLTQERMALIKQAFRLEWIAVAWMVIEGAVAISAGWAAGSLTLMAFGLDSVIELVSAAVLIWRLNVELRHGQAFFRTCRAHRKQDRGRIVVCARGLHRRRSRMESLDAPRRGILGAGLDSCGLGDTDHDYARTAQDCHRIPTGQPSDACRRRRKHYLRMALRCCRRRSACGLGPGRMVGGCRDVARDRLVCGERSPRGVER